MKLKTAIVIPTRGRLFKQITLKNIPSEIRENVYLVCPEKEAQSHELNEDKRIHIVAQPDDSWKIFEKRRWIMENAKKLFGTEKIVMLDDDLRWCYRRDDDPKKFNTATKEQVIQAFRELDERLCPDIPHAGFSARGGSISSKAMLGGWQQAKRMMCVLGYHVPTVMKNCDPFRIETREDMDVSLQLLRKGFPNVVNYTFLFDQKFGAPGGASLERDFARANADAETLAEFHPGLVRVVKKDDAGRAGLSEEARTRLEVVVQWEKALREGQQYRATSSRSRKGR